MASFSDRTVTVEWDGTEYSFQCNDAELTIIYEAASQLSDKMPEAGTGDYERIHNAIHEMVIKLVGEKAEKAIFNDRPTSIIDDMEVLTAFQGAVSKYVVKSMAETMNAYDPANVL